MPAVDPLFLCSLPRSGSTLLQRMLGAHSQIATAAEPWILLPLLYALRSEGVYSEYNHRVAHEAMIDFISGLDGGKATYQAACAEMVSAMYVRSSAPGSRYFLDKTPRYHLILEDILELFPNAKFVILWRNPLAVVASIMETWSAGKWRPYRYKIDLFTGLQHLVAAVRANPDRFSVVHYEQLVSDPQRVVEGLLSELELPFEPAVVSSFGDTPVQGRVGDRTGVRAYETVSTVPLDKWRASLASPVRASWARHYLRWIGGERLDVMGYDLTSLLDELKDAPTDYRRVPSDLYFSAKGLAWSLFEPTIMSQKLRRLPRWHRVYSHS